MISYFQLKLVLNIFQTCLKGFKLKMIVVEPKTTQSVEPNEESVDLFSSTGQMIQDKLGLNGALMICKF